jgi:hypothetical protein
MTTQTEFYIITSDHGPSGMGASDPCYNLDDAADALGEAERLTGRDARAIYVDVANGTSLDVTADCLAVIAKRLMIHRTASGNVIEYSEDAQ